jgi:hypothetical protein
MPSNVKFDTGPWPCFSGFTDAIAASSNNSEATGRIAEARDVGWRRSNQGCWRGGKPMPRMQRSCSQAMTVEESRQSVTVSESCKCADTNLAVKPQSQVAAGLTPLRQYEETNERQDKAAFSWQCLMIFRLSGWTLKNYSTCMDIMLA